MKAFTIATGAYANLAAVTAACFEWATGIAPVIVSEIADAGLGEQNVYAAKFTLPDAEPYVFFDADLLFLRPWSPPAGGVFAAAPVQLHDAGRASVAAVLPLPERLCSSGLFVASSAHAPVMARALEMFQEHHALSYAHEETFLNAALQELSTPVQWLPQTTNLQLINSVAATGLHFVMKRDAAAKLAAVVYYIQRFAPSALKTFLSQKDLGSFDAPRIGIVGSLEE